MNTLDPLYARLLQFGFLIPREAYEAKNDASVRTEIELLHNVPSLIGEPNAERHRYFLEQEQTAYREWVSESGSEEIAQKMRTYYEPIWEELERLFQLEEQEVS
jgi:hypothetical protein